MPFTDIATAVPCVLEGLADVGVFAQVRIDSVGRYPCVLTIQAGHQHGPVGRAKRRT